MRRLRQQTRHGYRQFTAGCYLEEQRRAANPNTFVYTRSSRRRRHGNWTTRAGANSGAIIRAQ